MPPTRDAGAQELAHTAEHIAHGIASAVTWPVHHIIDPAAHFLQHE